MSKKKHAHWIKIESDLDFTDVFECSDCKHQIQLPANNGDNEDDPSESSYRFCPSCGFDMKPKKNKKDAKNPENIIESLTRKIKKENKTIRNLINMANLCIKAGINIDIFWKSSVSQCYTKPHDIGFVGNPITGIEQWLPHECPRCGINVSHDDIKICWTPETTDHNPEIAAAQLKSILKNLKKFKKNFYHHVNNQLYSEKK